MWEELGQGKNSINILCMKKISQNKTKKEGRKERERLRETETERDRERQRERERERENLNLQFLNFYTRGARFRNLTGHI